MGVEEDSQITGKEKVEDVASRSWRAGDVSMKETGRRVTSQF